jgi:glyoxylase-like metal-dependent hydrolase (beta-lactamase superfamily II)
VTLEPSGAPGVHRVTDEVVNWYLVEDEAGLTAIDAGFPTAWSDLLSAIAALGRGRTDLAAVVLTHSHIDHIGFAERARAELGARVYVHEDDADLLRHPLRIAKSERNPLLYMRHGAARSLMAHALRSGAPRAKHVREWTTFRDGETLDVPGQPRVVFTPGHTFGHCALHLPDRDVLLAGDAVVTRNPYTGSLGPQIVADAATADGPGALASLDRIAETGAGLVLTGHGEPWTEGAAEAARLARLAGRS